MIPWIRSMLVLRHPVAKTMC